jgi:hypothetical protein
VAKKHAHSDINNLPAKAGRRVCDSEQFNSLAAPVVAVPSNKIVQSFHATFTTFQTLITNES